MSVMQTVITVEIVFLGIQLFGTVLGLFMFAAKIDKRLTLLEEKVKMYLLDSKE